MDLVLASASPRRKELLKEIEKEFLILPAKGEESLLEKNPKRLVKALARQKAQEIACEVGEEKIVLGADTVVAFKRNILGKPKDEQDAVRMLKSLSGRTHFVYTGVCFVYSVKGRKKIKNKVVATKVVFNELSDLEIERYVMSGSPMDKAGAYGIQDGGLVKAIVGSYSNVVGLPVELCKKLYLKIRKELENDKTGD